MWLGGGAPGIKVKFNQSQPGCATWLTHCCTWVSSPVTRGAAPGGVRAVGLEGTSGRRAWEIWRHEAGVAATQSGPRNETEATQAERPKQPDWPEWPRGLPPGHPGPSPGQAGGPRACPST